MMDHGQSTTLEPTATGPAPRPRRAGFFGVVARRQSWLNLAYLALAFPLGLGYFVFLVVCLSVGIGLVIVWVGLFVLGLTAAGWWACASFERTLADTLLGTELRPAPRPWRAAQGTLPRLKAHFSAAATWKDLAFLFVKFPLGVASFVVVVTLEALSFALMAAPFYYRSAHWTDAHHALHDSITLGAWHVDRLWQALLLVPLGVLLFIVSFHAFNGLAAMWRAVARGLLERDTSPQVASPAPGTGPAPAWPAGPGPSGAASTPTPSSEGPSPGGTPPPGWQPSPYDWPPAAQTSSPYDWPPAAQTSSPYDWPPPAWPSPYPGQTAQGQPSYPGQTLPGGPTASEQGPAPGQQPPQPWPAQGWQYPWAGQWPSWAGGYPPPGYGPPPAPPPAEPADHSADDPSQGPPTGEQPATSGDRPDQPPQPSSEEDQS